MSEIVTENNRIPVLKTRKLFIGGQFPRSESGRVRAVYSAKGKTFLANICLASRKDARDAVAAARKAFNGWAGKTAYNRGQILYRMAEMAEARRLELVQELVQATGGDVSTAEQETDSAIDRLIWYAGWCDKLNQAVGNSNAVAAPYFNFTIPEPMGVIALGCPDEMPLVSFISLVAPVITGGNTVVVFASERYPTVAIALAEIFATSDLPGGVINILTGDRAEILPVLAAHMDVNAIGLAGVSADLRRAIESAAAENVKRVRFYSSEKPADWQAAEMQNLSFLADYLEFKTVWHPVGS